MINYILEGVRKTFPPALPFSLFWEGQGLIEFDNPGSPQFTHYVVEDGHKFLFFLPLSP